jgi:glycosidase
MTPPKNRNDEYPAVLLPGTPIVYYGDEIGMGDNYYLGDRYGVRTPMQWTADKNAGFSHCNPTTAVFTGDYSIMNIITKRSILKARSKIHLPCSGGCEGDCHPEEL